MNTRHIIITALTVAVTASLAPAAAAAAEESTPWCASTGEQSKFRAGMTKRDVVALVFEDGGRETIVGLRHGGDRLRVDWPRCTPDGASDELRVRFKKDGTPGAPHWRLFSWAA